MLFTIPCKSEVWDYLENTLNIRRVNELDNGMVEVELPEDWSLSAIQPVSPPNPPGEKSFRYILNEHKIPVVHIDLDEICIWHIPPISALTPSTSINALED
jgi:hypothetical protein